MSHLRTAIRDAARRTGLEKPLNTATARARGAVQLLRPSPYPLHRNESFEPFFIVGSGRCGSTLLRRILQGSDEVHIPPENWALSRVILYFYRYRWNLDWDTLVRLTISYFAYQSAQDRWFGPHPLGPLIQDLSSIVREERSLARIVDAVYRYHGQVNGSSFTRWGDKTPMNVSHMQSILDVFPDARFIHLLRDGVDASVSLSRLEEYTDVREPALRWKAAVSQAQAFADKHPARCYELRYEDLVRGPAACINELCNFLSIDHVPQFVEQPAPDAQVDADTRLPRHENVFKPISSDHIGKGRRNLSQDQKRIFDALIGADLERCGYAPVI